MCSAGFWSACRIRSGNSRCTSLMRALPIRRLCLRRASVFDRQRGITRATARSCPYPRKVNAFGLTFSVCLRQQRSRADAIKQCFKTLSKSNPQWILEGDIKSCFDRISHDWLLAHVPMDRAILQKVAEIRAYGKTRPSRNNAWAPTAWKDLRHNISV